MRVLRVHVEFIEELLGTASADPEIHARFVASKAPDAASIEEEVAALGAEAVEERATTVFPRDADGRPFVYDYQWKGFFKDACGMLRRATGSKSAGLRAYKKEIDGLVFVTPRQVPLVLPEGGAVGECQRPLRAQTAQGERVALAHSETVPVGTTQDFTVTVWRDDLVPYVREWLAYGQARGLGQWRNSGKGRYVHTISDEGGNVIGGNI